MGRERGRERGEGRMGEICMYSSGTCMCSVRVTCKMRGCRRSAAELGTHYG